MLDYNGGLIPQPDFDGVYVSEDPYAYATIYFDRNLADLDNDGDVDYVDFSIFSKEFGKFGNSLADIADPTGENYYDGVVDEYDLKEIAANWLQ